MVLDSDGGEAINTLVFSVENSGGSIITLSECQNGATIISNMYCELTMDSLVSQTGKSVG